MSDLWFHYDAEFEGVVWPTWLTTLHMVAMRVRCLGLFHRFEECERGEGYWDHLWYCSRCFGPYEDDEEFVLSSPWMRLLWRLDRRLYRWWNSWAWRFER